jgi:nitric oxide reductase subunit B
MEKLSPQSNVARGRLSFFFFFLGLTNLMFNWGHHTYIVPAAPWIKTTSYIISMTELLILGFIILKWKKTVSNAIKNYHLVPFRFLSFADAWIFLNLTLAIIISVPAINKFTHGTHITVAHAMGATIGINTLLLFASVFFILKTVKPVALAKRRKFIGAGIAITNISLLIFWLSLIGSGLVKIQSVNNHEGFYSFVQKCQPYFKVFAYSGVFIFVGLAIIIIAAFKIFSSREQPEQHAKKIFYQSREPEPHLHDQTQTRS